MSNKCLYRVPFARVVFLAVLCLPSSVLQIHAAPLKQASVTRIINDVRVMEMPTNTQQPASLNQTVRDQQAVVTGQQSRAELLFSDKTLTRIGANSVFTFKEGTRNMDLKRGTMLLQVPKGAGGAQIKTAAVTAAITGTTLLVEYQPGGGAEVQTYAPTVPVADPAPASTGHGAVASDVEGNVRILVPGESTFRPLQEGEAIPEGSSLQTSGSGSAVVSPAPGVALRLLPNSTLNVNEADASGSTPKIRLNLKEGGVINMISKSRYKNVDYQVATPQGVCAARGTVMGIFIFGGKVFVLGAHGASAFNGQSVGAGQGIAFGPGGGSIPPGSPEFQNLLNQTVDAMNKAASQGLIPPGFLVQMQQQLEKGGVKLTPEQTDKLKPPAGSNNPPASNVAGGGEGQGFAKVVVLEGEVRVFITGKLGESMLVGPGQMLLFPPNTNRLPEPVDINLDLLVKTSKLVNPEDDSTGTGLADSGGNLNPELIKEEVEDQKKEIEKGTLGDTVFFVDGDKVTRLTQDQLDKIKQLQDALDKNPELFGQLETITGLNTLNGNTVVSTNPSITDTLTSTVYEGKIMTGIPLVDQASSKAAFLFGAQSPFDAAISFQQQAPVPAAGFRFESLTITENFPIVTTGPRAQPWLGLISETNIELDITGTPLSLLPLRPSNGGMFLATVDGDIDLYTGSVHVADASLVLYARDGNTVADFDGSGGSIYVDGGFSLDGGTMGAGNFTALAQNDMDFNGTATGFSKVDLDVGRGTLGFSGAVEADEVNLYSEGYVVPGGPGRVVTPRGTETALFDPAIYLFDGSTILAQTVSVQAPYIQVSDTDITGTSHINFRGDVIDFYNGFLSGPDIDIEAKDGFNWGGTTFAAITMGDTSSVRIRSKNISLLQDQINTNPDIKIDVELEGGTLYGNNNALEGIQNLSGQGTVLDLGSLAIVGGNLNFNGNVTVNGTLGVLDDGTQTKGIIDVTGDLIAGSISADGNIHAANITVTNDINANGATSSILTNGTLTLTGSEATANANGRVEVARLAAGPSSINTPLLRITQPGTAIAGMVNANTIEASTADLQFDGIGFYLPEPSNGTITAKGISATSGINFDAQIAGVNGFDLQVTTTSTTRAMTIGTNEGTDIKSIYANGGDSTTSFGGNGGRINLNAPMVQLFTNGLIYAYGGNSFFAPTANNGGNGGIVDIQTTQGFGVDGGFIFANGGTSPAAGGEGGNGGTIRASGPGNIKIENVSLLYAAAGNSGSVPPITPFSSTGGTIDLQTTGGTIIIDGGSQLITSNKTADPRTIAGRGGLIKLISNIAYGSANPTGNKAIQISNSTQLLALTNMADGVKSEILVKTTGNHANIEVNNATLRSDILKIQALNPSGAVNIYAGSELNGATQTSLFAGSLTSGGTINFKGTGQVDINTANFLARAGTINVGASTLVQVTGATNVGLYADNRNWTGNTGAGGIQVNGANAVPKVITINQNIGGANVNVNTRNAAGAPLP